MRPYLILLTLLTLMLPSNPIGQEAQLNESATLVVGPDTDAIQGITSDPDDVMQNKAYAHLEVVEGTAFILAGFEHPEGLNTSVRIEWFLYGWNQGSTSKDVLAQYQQSIGLQSVVVDTSMSVPVYDYYLLYCKNNVYGFDRYLPFSRTESRFSRIAPYNGIWERTGEVTSDRAVLHTYLTERPYDNATEDDTLRIPPMAGFAQFVVYRDSNLLQKVAESGFYPVDDYIQVGGEWRRSNYNFKWTVTGLDPDTQYYYQVEIMSSDGLDARIATNVNSFRTSPIPESGKDVAFVVVSCIDANNTAYSEPTEAKERGLKVFDSMLTYPGGIPDFIIMTGDTVYYDGGDYAPDIGVYHFETFSWRWLFWYAQYNFDNFLNFFQAVPGYWMIDDHDYWVDNINDRKPDGWYIFRNVNPTPGSSGTMGEDSESYYNGNLHNTSRGSGSKFWRTVRWGKHLEIFIEEGRHHRDFEGNLIWGDEQRNWLEQRIINSDATFKVIAATTPLLGPVPPDYYFPSKEPDKHASLHFRQETEQFLNNIRQVPNVYIVAGDRHFKYHSVINGGNYPLLSQFNEFGSGSAAAPPHAVDGGGIASSDFATLQFADGHRGPGASAGYLRVEVTTGHDGAEIRFKLIRVTDELDNDLIYEKSFFAPLPAIYFPVIIAQNGNS